MSVNYSAGLSPYEHKGNCGMPEKIESGEVLIEKSHKLSDLIKESKLTVVFTGAGISTSAGIPDFRGPEGVWTLEKQGKSPECNITFEDAVPTFSHRCLVQMEQKGLIHFVISQNVDGLHVRSGFPRDRLAELHGNMFTQKCQLCNREFVMDFVSPTMGLKSTGSKCLHKKRRGNCRGVLCDTILDWEDALPDDQLEMSEKFSRAAELAIVIGSSLQIIPAGNLPLFTKRNQGKLVIINLQTTKHDKHADLRIYGYADEVMKIVAEDLKITVPDYQGPSVCLQSLRAMPDLPAFKKATSNARKRKQPTVASNCSNSEGNFPDTKTSGNKQKQELNESKVKAELNLQNNIALPTVAQELETSPGKSIHLTSSQLKQEIST
ncbi:unnamed protein product [Clavelina lepadiformis]|uniref:protein acetyllysine N-acetyltransferase n=1 Tax=Clavelina lepadiformis TaxID=159417 RepID=A0ABP0H3C9_CLALP